MVRATSARPRGARPVVPAKITSSILPPRRLLAPCSPITQDRASTTLDLPEPLGPTTQVMPGSKRRAVAEAKDLKPRRVRLFRCTARPPPHGDPTRHMKRALAAGLYRQCAVWPGNVQGTPKASDRSERRAERRTGG